MVKVLTLVEKARVPYFALQGFSQAAATRGGTAEEVKRLPKETQELKSRKLSPDPIGGRIILASAAPLIDRRTRGSRDYRRHRYGASDMVHEKGTDQTCLSISPFLSVLSLLTEALQARHRNRPFRKYSIGIEDGPPRGMCR